MTNSSFLTYLTILILHNTGIFFFFLIILFLAVLGLHGCAGFVSVWCVGATLQVKCAGFSLQQRLLLGRRAWAPGHRLPQLQHVGSVIAAPGLQSTGSTVVAHGLSCYMACGIFLGQGWNPRLLNWQADSLTLSHQGRPNTGFFKSKHICKAFKDLIKSMQLELLAQL